MKTNPMNERISLRFCHILFFVLAGFYFSDHAHGQNVKGYSLTEIGDFLYDASIDPEEKTPAQLIVDKLFDLGVRQINLSPRAVMVDPRGSELIPITKGGADRSDERNRYLRLIRYIHSKEMSVGIRPIFFVVDSEGRTPYRETLPDGTIKDWWHGNIQPQDPYRWFESFRGFLDIYLPIARLGNVEEFTIGAELYSMTVGIEDQWVDHPHGFPREWVDLLRYSRSKLRSSTRVMYDINFTDAVIDAGGLDEFGGEFARWRYRLVDLADPANDNWQNLAAFWKELDAIGIDMYRSLATNRQNIPDDYQELVAILKATSDRYASQIDNAMFEIETTLEHPQIAILKEIGYRSVRNGFIDPFVYADSDQAELNIDHQAAAYEAIFQSFFSPGWSWFRGAVFWDASVDLSRHGSSDRGFSPIGKDKTEDVIKDYFLEEI
jgi:hypothetical protein